MVDDGSSHYAEIARGPAPTESLYTKIAGLGELFASVEAALEEGADIMVNIDADGQFNPHDIGTLLVPVLSGAADIVSADRFGEHAAKIFRSSKTSSTDRRAPSFPDFSKRRYKTSPAVSAHIAANRFFDSISSRISRTRKSYYRRDRQGIEDHVDSHYRHLFCQSENPNDEKYRELYPTKFTHHRQSRS